MFATPTLRRVVAAMIVALVFVAGAAACSSDDKSSSKSIKINDPWAMNATLSQGNGAAFMIIENTSSTEDELIAVSVPSSVAAEAQMHDVTMQGEMMKVVQVQSVSIPANGTRDFKHGSYHLMLMELKNPLEIGSNVDITLTFKNAGKMTVSFPVEKS